MKRKNTIFDSKSEKKVYSSLKSRWSHKLAIYPQLPLTKIVQIDRKEITENEWNAYLKMNVDYTFCLADGIPILSIEFDGIGGGFSKDGKYIQVRETDDPNRKLKMDFKLRVSKAVDYPLIVVSYEEVESFDGGDILTVLDGIIGQLLAKDEFQNRISKIELHGDESHEYIQYLISGIEVEAELEIDPIAKKAAEYELACSRYDNFSYRVEHLSDPPLPEIENLFDLKGLEARVEAMKKTERVGCQIIIKAPRHYFITSPTVWLRNFEGFSIYPPLIAENIARYLTFKKAYSIFSGREGASSGNVT